MTRNGQTRRAWVAALVVVAVVGIVDRAEAGRSKHLEYADEQGVVIPDAPEGKALVVFLRPEKKGRSVHASIFNGDEFLGFVQSNTCVLYEADPGEHSFMVIGETANFMDADLEAGKIYFAQVKVKMGAWKARFVYRPITAGTKDWEKLPGWLSKAHLVELRQSGTEWYAAKKEAIDAKKARALPSANRVVLASTDGVTDF